MASNRTRLSHSKSNVGFDDLVVANGGDGAFALFEGSTSGLALTSTQLEPDVPSPTDLAFSALTGGQIEFYAVSAGHESATSVSFSLQTEAPIVVSPSPPVEAPSPSPPGPTGVTVNGVAQLVPLNETSLALVGSLLTLTITSPGSDLDFESADVEATASIALPAGAGGSTGQSRLHPDSPEDAESVDRDSAGGVIDVLTNLATSAASAWERFILGLDEALDRFRTEFQGRTLDHSEGELAVPGTVESRPTGVVTPPDGSTSWRSAPGTPAAGTGDDSTESPRGAQAGAIVDASIQSLWGEDVSEVQPVQALITIPIHFKGALVGVVADVPTAHCHPGRSTDELECRAATGSNRHK